MPKPLPTDFNPFYGTYVHLVPQHEALEAIVTNTSQVVRFFQSIPVDKQHYAYAPGKWTIKQVLQHITDAERIFAYRALRFVRADETPLPGWEENDYAAHARVDHLHWNDMIDEFLHVRKASEHLYKHLNEAELARSGTANNSFITVNALGFVIPGHALHHMKVIEERY
ncbi:DinB family protein [Chitinophaga horti]|uniref:DinB family protein n=1 Tax=Chitinophaga horti TaxID=2920382 RepID=A0ABY6J2Q4_9BACT|nr:DinB family protein [Chitinophaga horti]UYQ93953.1 DinB family protein [Chitinophaga horti]